MTQFTLIRHSRYAVAADPNFEDAVEVCELNIHQAYRVRAAGGPLFATREAAQDAAVGGAGAAPHGHFSSLRIAGAEVFIPHAGAERLDGVAVKASPSGTRAGR